MESSREKPASGASEGARKAKIKQHHNVKNGFRFLNYGARTDIFVPELIPLADMVKDGVRDLGRSLGIPEEVLMQHPFPGPGLSVYIWGEVTRKKLLMCRAANRIWIDEIRNLGVYDEIWQAQAEVTGSTVTCTKGDEEAMGEVIRLCAAVSVNGFTAIPYEFEKGFVTKVSTRIVNEVLGVGQCDEKKTPKPPATIVCG